jgi:hypothetical protein
MSTPTDPDISQPARVDKEIRASAYLDDQLSGMDDAAVNMGIKRFARTANAGRNLCSKTKGFA